MARTFPKLFNDASFIPIPKSVRDITIKESYMPIFLINVDLKIYKKILADQIQHCMKRII